MLGIGALSRATGCKVPTIRYYEDIGLMPAAERSAGNQRRYSDTHVRRLRFIRHARELGFHLDDIRTLLDLSDRPDRECAEADAIARTQLAEVERRITSLQALQSELQRMVRQCRGGHISDCRVIDILSDHALCLGEHPSDLPDAAGRQHAPRATT